MTLRVRRILSLIFILLFFTITPAIILYAAGYRLGRNVFSVERTGMFMIDSRPRNAKILLNGQVQETWLSSLFKQKKFLTTPAKIKNLLPGEYTVAVELNGYLSWQKKLTIGPGAATFAENISLFKNNPPSQIMPAQAVATSLAPDKKQILIISDDRLTFFNLADETQKFVAQKGLAGKNIAWSPDGARIVIDGYLFNLNDLSAKTELRKLTAGAFNYKWSGDLLYYQAQNSVFALTSETSVKKILSGVAASDFLVKAANLFVITETKPVNSLTIYDLASGKKIRNIALPSAGNNSFINPEHSLLNIYDQGRKIIYLIDPTVQYYSPLIETINNVNNSSWLNQNNLLYTNDFEIWLYNLAGRQKTLITRISAVINNAVMHPNNNYLIYSTAKTINAIELDEREKRNIAELARLDLIGPLTINSEGNLLYFPGKTGSQSGLYKLLIQ